MLLILIKPLVLLGLTLRAWLRRLKPTYVFEFIEQGVEIETEKYHNSMPWSRFVAYHKTPKFMLLEFNVAGDPDPNHLLFPSRFMSENRRRQLAALFIEHGLPKFEPGC